MVGEGHGAVHALLDEDHRGPLGVHPLHDVHEALDRHGGEAEGELVDHEEPGFAHHDPRQRQHLLLAARQRARGLVETGLELGEEADGVVEGRLGARRLTPEGVAADADVLAHAQAGERHLPPHEQGGAEVDDLLGLEVGAVGPEDADDPSVGMVESRHRPEQGALAGPVGTEQGHDVALGDLEVHVEEHLLVPVVEVHVVDLQGGDLAARLAPLALGVALQDVLDDEGDVAAHVARADEKQHAPDGAHRPDQGERGGDVRGVADGAEQDAAREAAEDERIDAEQPETDGPHFRRGRRRQGLEDADGQRRHRRLRQELEDDHHPQVRHVQRQAVEAAEDRDADAGDDQGLLGGAPEELVPHGEDDGQPQERRQADDREHVGAVRHA